MKFKTLISIDQEGKSTVSRRDEMERFLKANAGNRLILEIRKQRSAKQNNVWWMYMGILSDHTGFTPEEMHEVCKFKFLLTEKVNENTGEVMNFIRSTRDLSSTEMNDLQEKLKVWAAESLKVVLPDPNQQIDLFDE